jgi:hypothetical protein
MTQELLGDSQAACLQLLIQANEPLALHDLASRMVASAHALLEAPGA